MNIGTLKGCLAAVLLGLSVLVQAEDIDLFVGVDTDDIDLPNILFIIDNSANWNRDQSGENIYASVKGALSTTFAGLQEDSVRVGIMMYNESGNDAGGYVRAAVRAMSEGNKQAYAALINSLASGGQGDQGSKATVSLAIPEAWYYFSGGAPHSGGDVSKADYQGNNSGTPASNSVYALAGNALSKRNATSYNKPSSAGICAKNYIVFLSNGPGNESNSDIKESNRLLAIAGGSAATEEIRLSPGGQQDNPVDEWTRFMKQSSLGITTYTIEVWPETTGQGPNWTAVLNSMANVSGGRYFPIYSSTGDADTTSQITDAISTILSEIQSVNSVYASVSLPVSVNTQGTYLNQVFIGMFRPAEDASPRWHGNLKQYKLGRPANSSSLQTLDADNQPAINSNTGFITECARSFWTPRARDTYWSDYGEDRLHCLLSGLAASSNSPDGNQVEKGGHAYLLRDISPSSRKVYVESSTAITGVTALSTSSVSGSQLGAVDQDEHSALIDWIYGTNNVADDSLDGFAAAGAMRPSVHGDIVHSRPVAINYGSDESPDVRVFYGGNDGLLRSINGNTDGGNEVWAFLPEAFYSKVKRLRDNSPVIYYPGLTTAGAIRKDYGFDGPVAAYQDSEQAWIFASMRRGGRSIYAFDVSGKDSPPKLMWHVGCSGDTCSEGYEAIGQTWASPAVVSAAGHTGDNGSLPILLVGGGYDPCEDEQPHTCSTSSKGNRLYVINAKDGSLLKQFTTKRGVIADITPVKNRDGYLAYGYTADLGGNVYRLSGPGNAPIGHYPPTDWVLTHIASLGCDTSASNCSENRKFMYAPDVVLEGDTYHLLLGSGDREKPIGNAGSTQNHFFMIKDQPGRAVETPVLVGLEHL
ncbi:MAG: PilC/PilY family type IV pilus protein, partial [Pseudomonas sp.]